MHRNLITDGKPAVSAHPTPQDHGTGAHCPAQETGVHHGYIQRPCPSRDTAKCQEVQDEEEN